MTRTHVLMPQEVLDKVDSLVGQRRRSQFLTEAVKEKLARVRLAELARKAAGSFADADIPGWESSQAAAAWVRSLRLGDEEGAVRSDSGVFLSRCYTGAA